MEVSLISRSAKMNVQWCIRGWKAHTFALDMSVLLKKMEAAECYFQPEFEVVEAAFQVWILLVDNAMLLRLEEVLTQHTAPSCLLIGVAVNTDSPAQNTYVEDKAQIQKILDSVPTLHLVKSQFFQLQISQEEYSKKLVMYLYQQVLSLLDLNTVSTQTKKPQNTSYQIDDVRRKAILDEIAASTARDDLEVSEPVHPQSLLDTDAMASNETEIESPIDQGQASAPSSSLPHPIVDHPIVNWCQRRWMKLVSSSEKSLTLWNNIYHPVVIEGDDQSTFYTTQQKWKDRNSENINSRSIEVGPNFSEQWHDIFRKMYWEMWPFYRVNLPQVPKALEMQDVIDILPVFQEQHRRKPSQIWRYWLWTWKWVLFVFDWIVEKSVKIFHYLQHNWKTYQATVKIQKEQEAIQKRKDAELAAEKAKLAPPTPKVNPTPPSSAGCGESLGYIFKGLIMLSFFRAKCAEEFAPKKPEPRYRQESYSSWPPQKKKRRSYP